MEEEEDGKISRSFTPSCLFSSSISVFLSVDGCNSFSSYALVSFLRA